LAEAGIAADPTILGRTVPRSKPNPTPNHHFDKITWSEFSRRYRQELKEGGSIDRRNKNIKNHGQKFTLRLLQRLGKKGHTITLMCHCDEDQPNCHRYLLQRILKGKI
jgi:uncharacterized protein YeaO (DUF488 family)